MLMLATIMLYLTDVKKGQLRICGQRSQMTLIINRQAFYGPFFTAASLLFRSASCAFLIHCTLQNTKDYDKPHFRYSQLQKTRCLTTHVLKSPEGYVQPIRPIARIPALQYTATIIAQSVQQLANGRRIRLSHSDRVNRSPKPVFFPPPGVRCSGLDVDRSPPYFRG